MSMQRLPVRANQAPTQSSRRERRWIFGWATLVTVHGHSLSVIPSPSFPRRRESRRTRQDFTPAPWIPAFGPVDLVREGKMPKKTASENRPGAMIARRVDVEVDSNPQRLGDNRIKSTSPCAGMTVWVQNRDDLDVPSVFGRPHFPRERNLAWDGGVDYRPVPFHATMLP